MAEHIGWIGNRSLGELIHAAIRRTIEVAAHAELAAALGAARYARCDGRHPHTGRRASIIHIKRDTAG